MKPTHALTALFFGGLVAATPPKASAQQNQATVSLEMLKDRRNRVMFNALDVSLRVKGGDIAEATYIRALPHSATDSTGKNLIATLKPHETLEKAAFREKKGLKSALTSVELLNPVRQATHLREVSGVVQMFFPQRDAQSVVTIANIHPGAGRPAEAPLLQASGLEITFFTKAQPNTAEADKMGIDMDEIAVLVQDSGKRLVDIVFEDASGQKLDKKSWSWGTSIRTYTFQNPIPNVVRARIYVATPKSLVEIPFQFNDLKLP